MRLVNGTISKVFFLISLALCISCKKNIKSKADLIDFINNPDNGLKKTCEIGKIKAVLLYKPWQLMATNGTNPKKQETKYGLNYLKSKY